MAGMLLGTYHPILIGKNRLALPAKLRREIKGHRVVLATGFDECILGFEESQWERVTATDLARPLSDVEGRELRRKMFAGAEVIELGVQGRFVIPQVMAEYAGIKRQVILIGAGDHFEIWDQTKWQQYQAKLKDSSSKEEKE